MIRRTLNGEQYTIFVDLNRAMACRRQRIQVQAGDVLVLQYSPQEQLQNIGIGTVNAFGIRSVLGR